MIEKEMIKSKYGNIAAYKKGAGPKTILLLHGAGCDSTMLSWREVFKALSDDFTVYAFDFLGYGRSDKADELVGDRFFDTHIDYTVYEGPDALQQPAGRVGNPMDIANMVMFLCSDKAGFITGENICIDGGMTKLMIYHDDHRF